MGGGLMQLVAYGAQDVYLTGNPQITFFKVVYRRHTNFSMESIQQTWNGTVGLGNKVTCTISRNGDLIHSMYLDMNLTSCGETTVDNLGHALVKEVTVEIGGQTIDKQYGEWLDIWSDLTLPASKRDGYNQMINDESGKVRHLMVPLQFWFCRNAGLALPLIALQYHEVKVSVQFKAATDIVAGQLDSSALWVDYIYLDTDERRRFAQVSHEYLIEQLQFPGTDPADNKHRLNFNHPVKELVWVENATGAANWRNWVATSDDNIKVVLNGHDRMGARGNKYYTHVQPYNHHSNIPSGDAEQFVSTGAAEDTLAGNEAAGETTMAVGAETATVGSIVRFSGDGDTDNDCNNYIVTAVSGDGSNVVTISPALKSAKKTGAKLNYFHHIPNNRCSRNIHVYSFALKPEEHQPSGTCNFSRIDNADLLYNGTSGNSVSVFAVNYNVLRIMSGMGGLAYSN